MVTATQKVIKQVQVIARIELKQHPGIVVYKVRSSNGVDVYETVIAYGKASSCSCVSRKPCYHMAQCEAKEQERIATEHKIDEDIEQHIDEELIDSPIDPRYQVVPGKCNGCGIESKWAVCHRCSWQ